MRDSCCTVLIGFFSQGFSKEVHRFLGKDSGAWLMLEINKDFVTTKGKLDNYYNEDNEEFVWNTK